MFYSHVFYIQMFYIWWGILYLKGGGEQDVLQFKWHAASLKGQVYLLHGIAYFAHGVKYFILERTFFFCFLVGGPYFILAIIFHTCRTVVLYLIKEVFLDRRNFIKQCSRQHKKPPYEAFITLIKHFFWRKSLPGRCYLLG